MQKGGEEAYINVRLSTLMRACAKARTSGGLGKILKDR